ncbi:phytoene/squalene synthase family protein [Cellulomonas rhizosphaerae]|uniref:Phytoene/squalene synthase family protein n=1 Tax=Cellulomonas rhizosphaerae TaxID=2293719 RepID=A0A413RMC1_9CELL|nr:squalene/phytoene synthase family protein [Cellulomonas rhizosphaerae]RHA41624.1 phytoene/squalene synthase family protein [Cellulomonas rhizosphaerae]
MRTGTRHDAPSLYDSAADHATAQIVEDYSTSFSRACRLLAEPVRTHVRSIYGLVRLADEIVDADSLDLTPAERATQLSDLEAETAHAMARGFSTNLVVHSFARTARQCGIDATLVTPFFASMRTDLERTEHDAGSLDTYVYGSAEVVGLMCLRAFLAEEDASTGDARYAELLPGARRLGAAFQKVNFLRDIAADHDTLGRTYFPGVVPAELTESQRDVLLDDIDADLAAAAQAIAALPASSRRAVRCAHDLFAALSHRLRATPAGEIGTRRVRVSTPAKARIVLRAMLSGAR